MARRTNNPQKTLAPTTKIDQLRKRLSVKEQERLCINMIRNGHTVEQIAEATGLDDENAIVRIVNRKLAKADILEANTLRRLQNDRLNWLLQQLFAAVQSSNMRAAQTALGVIDRICKLNGLDAPEKIVQTQQQTIKLDMSNCSDDDLKRLSNLMEPDDGDAATPQ